MSLNELLYWLERVQWAASMNKMNDAYEAFEVLYQNCNAYHKNHNNKQIVMSILDTAKKAVYEADKKLYEVA